MLGATGECAFFWFSLNDYDFTNSNGGTLGYHGSGYANMGVWIDHAATLSAVAGASLLNRNIYRDACCTITWRGNFAATREQIKNEAYFPNGSVRELYAYLHSWQHYASEEVDHFIERTWRSLFCARR